METFYKKPYGQTKISKKGQIVIPKKLREELDMKDGDSLLALPIPEYQGVYITKFDDDLFDKMMETYIEQQKQT